MSRDINPFGLRMPQELKTRLEEAARASGRSLNAEIVKRLEDSFEWELVDPLTDVKYVGQLEDFSSRLKRSEQQIKALMAMVEVRKAKRGKAK